MNNSIYGGIIGDMVGSIYEWRPCLKDKINTFPFWSGKRYQPFTHPANRKGSKYTDDTVTGICFMKALLEIKDFNDESEVKETFKRILREICPLHEWTGFGSRFWIWVTAPEGNANQKPYNSWGNGSAMRVFPIGLYFDTLEETQKIARWSAEITHNHEKGVAGAVSVASAMFLARQGKSKEEIKEYITKEFGYDLNRDLNEIRKTYGFDVSCQGSVPESIMCFLEGNSFEECVRLAVSLGGDADTMGCITGSMAACMYQIPDIHYKEAYWRLPKEFRKIIKEFNSKCFQNKSANVK